MMERTKKEKQERQFKKSLKTIAELQPTLLTPAQVEGGSSLLAKVYPQVAQLNSLRILTVLEITYLLELHIELLDKSDPKLLSEFRIGIIGGGITGRLILNSLLPLSKDGLNLRNVTVSTRQTDNFKIYVQNFGIQCHFDNEKTAKQSDFLVIATPATLDNWVIADLKAPIAERIAASDKKSQKQLSISGIKQLTEKSKKSFSKDEKNKNQQKEVKNEQPERKFPFKPLVYILTSDFHQQKCKKFFNFPILTPSIRAKDIPAIKETLELFSAQQGSPFETHQKILAWWLLRQKQDKSRIKSADSQNLRQALSQKNEVIEKYLKSPLNNLISILCFANNTSSSTASISSSRSNTISLSENVRDTKVREESLTQVVEVVTSHGEIDQSLFKKLRKWTMAHNNFIS